MKKVLKKFNRTLSIMLAAAMVLTMVPQTAMPVLAAEEAIADTDVTPEDVGETVEAPESGQNEDVTVPSDEGNPDTEGDDISDETPVEEDPVTEEPSEGDVEEVEEPTIGVMVEGEDETDPSTDTFNVTTPPNPQGYIITDAAETATKDTDYTFKVKANDNWRITAVTYKVADSEEETTLTAGEDNITYTIDGAKITGDITISVTAVQTVKVTVTAPDTVTVQYTVNDAVLDSATSPVTVDKGDKVKLTVTPKDATYDVVVKKGNTSVQGEANVYDLGEIVADAAYTVTATKNRYAITETINTITVNEDEEGSSQKISSATIDYGQSGNDYTAAEDQKPQMIAKNKDLKFTLKYNDYFDGKTPKVVVSYTVGADEKATTLTANNSGVYTIQKAKITGDIALNVYVDEYKTFAVTMIPDENVETIQYAIGTEALKDFPAAAENAENGERVLEDVTEDSVLKFQLTAKKYYKIKEVKAGDEVLKADTKGIYTLTVSEEKTITVTTEEDSAQKRSLAFKVTGDAKSASASIIDGLDVAQTVEAGGTVELAATTGDELTLTITPKDGYIIKSVAGATEVTEAADADTDTKQYKVKFTTAKTATVTVTTDAAESTKESKVVFTEDSSVSHMSYNVKNGGNTKVTKDEEGKYTVAEGAKKLEFTITVTGSYKPTVKMSGKDDENKDPETGGEDGNEDDKTREAEEDTKIVAAKVTLTKTGATYDYVVPATQLKDNNSVTISESKDERVITLGGEGFANVDIVASINGIKRNADDNSENKKYTVLLNDVVTFQITAGTNSNLKKVVSKIGDGKETNAKIANNTATVEVKVTADTTIDITTDDQYVASKLKENGTELKPADEKKNSYNVAYNGTYTAEVVKGKNSDPATLSKVNVLLGNNPVAAKTDGDSVCAIDTANTNKASIDLSKADVNAIAGKTLTVELYASESTGDDATDVKVATYSLIVSVPAKDIKIDKKDKQTVAQAIDTTKTYTVTAAKGVDLMKLEATVVDEKGIIATTVVEDDDDQNSETLKPQVTYENGKLTVTMAAKKPEADATATITIKEQGAEGGDASTATLTITAAELINGNTTAPTVKLAAATDVAFKLTLSAKTGQAASGNLYYKVESKEKGTDGDFKATYVQKVGDSQTTMVTVSDASKVAEYEVKASLVHLDKAVENNTLVDGTETLGGSKVSNAQILKTLTPAYEDKLKLKKGKTTIVTGEKDIVIAEPQYNKYTTFLSLAENGAVDITPNISEDAKLAVQVTTSGLDEKITATATDKTWVGKHKIQVTASAEKGAVASVATIDVTVVRGIHKLDVTVPSTNLYKANKKVAKVKATVVYNQDITTSQVPKNKNVTWEIVGQGTNASYIEKMVTVKNGTVTVDKSFIVDTVEANNQFKIKVTANNEKSFAGGTYNDDKLEPIVGESPVITITGAGEDIKTIVIKKDNYTKASPTGTKDPCEVHASDINAGNVVVLDSKGNEINLSLITLKSSNQKSVPVYENGWIGVNKVGKVKLTATAKDGSNNKAELSLNIINDETTEDLSLQIVKAHYEYDESSSWPAKDTAADDDEWKAIALYDPNDSSMDATAIKYDGSTTPLIAVQVMQKIEEEEETYYQDSVPYFANYKLTVNGGKIVAQWGDMAYIATNATAKTVTLKLTNAAVKSSVAKEFILTNTGVQVKPAFKVLNKLHSFGTAEEQTADIEVTKLPEDAADLVAKVEVDWSAKNAKNEADLAEFAGMLEDYYEVKVADNKGNFRLALESDDEMIYLNQKSYKLTVTLGTTTTTGEDDDAVTTFTAKTLPTSMTVSVDSAKKFTFKPTTSYTLTTKDAKASTLLTGKASVTDYTVKWENLQNLNTKGVTNKFAEYFNVVDDGEGNYSIKLAKLNGDALPDKADCTGYITYTATAEKNYYSDKIVSGTVKITVKLDDKKTVATYSQGKIDNKLPEIGLTKESTTTTRIDAKIGKNSSPAKLSYVTVDSNDTVSKDFAVAKAATDGNLSLTYNGDGLVKNKTYKVKLYIVPEGSYYKEIIATAESANSEDSEAVATLTARYGILVTVQVKAVEAPSVAKTYEVTITEGADSVVAGSNTVTYKATVTEDGNALENPTVTWSVKGGTGATTGIGENTGVLTVDDSEEAETVLTITATYKPEGADAVTGTKTVTVTAADGNGGN